MNTLKEEKLAKLLIDHSLRLESNEVLFFRFDTSAISLAEQIIKYASSKHINVITEVIDSRIESLQLKNNIIDESFIQLKKDIQLNVFNKMDAYLSIGANHNDFSLSDIDSNKLLNYRKVLRETLDVRLSKKWAIMMYPTLVSAQKAGMTYDKYYEFCFDAMLNNYKELEQNEKKLVSLLNKTDKVQIIADETNLTFSIKDIDVVQSFGLRNIPDGEVFTAPVRDSINGYIKFNTTTSYNSKKFENIKFEFKNGKIIKALCNDNENNDLEEILNIDDGARYIGEFAFGLNRFINRTTESTLYDEKIGGSIHLTPGSSYKTAYNGNNSSIHWDIVLLMNNSKNGTKIYLDDVLVQENGLFVLEDLKALN